MEPRINDGGRIRKPRRGREQRRKQPIGNGSHGRHEGESICNGTPADRYFVLYLITAAVKQATKCLFLIKKNLKITTKNMDKVTFLLYNKCNIKSEVLLMAKGDKSNASTKMTFRQEIDTDKYANQTLSNINPAVTDEKFLFLGKKIGDLCNVTTEKYIRTDTYDVALE